MKKTCSIPPSGWVCSRVHGHSGPCAARPLSAEPYIDEETDLCLELLIQRMRFLDSQERWSIFNKLKEFYCHDCGKKMNTKCVCHCENDEEGYTWHFGEPSITPPIEKEKDL